MALEFNPPTALINDYLNRPSSGQIASSAINNALQTYAQQKAMAAQQQQAKLKQYVDAFSAGGPDLASQIGKLTGLQNPPTLPQTPMQSPAGAPPPPPPSNQVTPAEDAAQQSLPTEHVPDTSQDNSQASAPISSIVQAHLSQPGIQNHANIQMPDSSLTDNSAALLNQGAYGQKQLTARESLGKYQQSQSDKQIKAEENAPKSFDYARAFAKNAGSPDAAENFIKIAQAEGRDKLTKREIADLKDSINVSAQKGRGDFYEGSLGLKQQQMRDSLIKEARGTLDPYFQTGAGKQLAMKFNRIAGAEPLVDQMLSQSGGGDTRQMRELGTSVAAIITGGNVVAQNQVEEMIPKTYKGTFNQFIESLTNNPTGLDQQAFIKRFKDTIQREKAATQSQSRAIAERSAPTLRVLKQSFPQDYDAVVGNYLNNSPEIMGPTAGAAQPVSVPVPSKKVRVSNGKETLMIDPADIVEAQKDGYQVVP